MAKQKESEGLKELIQLIGGALVVIGALIFIVSKIRQYRANKKIKDQWEIIQSNVIDAINGINFNQLVLINNKTGQRKDFNVSETDERFRLGVGEVIDV